MAGKFKNLFRSFSDDDYDDDEFYDDDDYDYEEDDDTPKLGGFFRKKSQGNYEDDYDDDYDDYEEKKPSKVSRSSKITSINRGKGSVNDVMDVRIIKPSNFDMDTHDIADNLLEQRTVILNLEGIDVGLAQRIIDFSFGACYALHGNFRAITKSILLITPPNVNISGVLLDKVNESIDISED